MRKRLIIILTILVLVLLILTGCAKKDSFTAIYDKSDEGHTEESEYIFEDGKLIAVETTMEFETEEDAKKYYEEMKSGITEEVVNEIYNNLEQNGNRITYSQSIENLDIYENVTKEEIENTITDIGFEVEK